MSYPPVTQFETRALQAEAQARLTRERRAARTPKHAIDRSRRLRIWLPLPRPRARAAERALSMKLKLSDCEQ
jgi:hypothetical protein